MKKYILPVSLAFAVGFAVCWVWRDSQVTQTQRTQSDVRLNDVDEIRIQSRELPNYTVRVHVTQAHDGHDFDRRAAPTTPNTWYVDVRTKSGVMYYRGEPIGDPQPK